MIYIILPIYNEEENLLSLITALRNLMTGKNYHIVAVNDGSLDESSRILNDLKGADLSVTGSLINMNIGAVFASGIDQVLKKSQNDDDVCIIMESDQTSEMLLFDDLVSQIRNYKMDIVIASRYQKNGAYVNFPFFRKAMSLGANSLMQFFFPIKNIFDYSIFYRAYRIGLLRKMSRTFGFGLMQSMGFVANAELLIKASWLTNKIVEIPFVYDYAKKKGKSKISPLRTINEYFVLITNLKKTFQEFQKT